MMEVRAASRTDVGRARERNEDSYFAGKHVFAVADGLGGHRAGEVASTLALEPIASLDALDPARAAADVADKVRSANRSVFERADADTGLKGMGTTMTAVVLYDGKIRLAHVGDSRCYLLRGDTIEQLSKDHTLVARMVAEGKLTPEQAEVHPQRSMLTRALGADRDVDIDEAEFSLEPGDRLLLCSDGLTGMLSDGDIRALVTAGSDIDEICEHLVDEANARGGLDNITAVVVDVSGSWSVAAPGARPLRKRDPYHHRRGGRRITVRPIAWAAVVVLFAAGGWIGVRTWTRGSYYVGIQGDRVVIFRGVPVEFGAVKLSEPEEPTPIYTQDVQPYFIDRLEEGMRADSLEEARRIVEEQLSGALKPGVELSPSGSATPTPTPEETP